MRALLITIVLQGYAVLLAWMQSFGGVRTDEAKYLLNIPYPHPPVLRWLMQQTEFISQQEFLWRAILATLLVQAVWIVWDLGRERETQHRLALCLFWLGSAAFVQQTGSILMVSVAAFGGLLFVWLLTRARPESSWAGAAGLFWLGLLFTVFQAVLWTPLVFGVFRRLRIPFWQQVLFTGVPLVLFCLYLVTNPLALAVMLGEGGRHATTLAPRVLDVGGLWLYAGCLVLGITGVLGLFASRQIWLILAFLLLCLYVALSSHPYNAILFLPILVGGFAACQPFLRTTAILTGLSILGFAAWLGLNGALPYPAAATGGLLILFFFFVVLGRSVVLHAGAFLLVSAFLFYRSPPRFMPSEARMTMQRILPISSGATLYISGSFGHQWQYESSLPIRRYRPEPHDDPKMIVVCVDRCLGLHTGVLLQITGVPVASYLRSKPPSR